MSSKRFLEASLHFESDQGQAREILFRTPVQWGTYHQSRALAVFHSKGRLSSLKCHLPYNYMGLALAMLVKIAYPQSNHFMENAKNSISNPTQ